MDDLGKRNRRILTATLVVVAAMVALSFASVPLYRAFCKVTGWGGVTKQATVAPTQVLSREMTVQFNADVDSTLPWAFKPDLWQAKARIGQRVLISYTAENHGRTPIAGSAVYNVTPLKAGKYFNKIQCFCFSEQVLEPGQKVHMPVLFFIDPKIMDDAELRDLKTITLSYTFYRQDSPQLEKAVEKFIDADDNPTSKTK